MNGVRSIDRVAPAEVIRAEGVQPKQDALEAGGISFDQVLGDMVASASAAQNAAAAKSEALAAGAIDDVHGTMLSVKEAEISMKLVGTVRNKLLEAFHELWRTSV